MKNSLKTHCKAGHLFDENNTYHYGTARICRTCRDRRVMALRPVAPPKKTPSERFWPKVDKSVGQGPAGECWQWQGTIDKCGYGRFRIDGRLDGAHRISYYLTHGPLPAGANILHKCDNPRCVNPAHLSVGTHRDNMQDKSAKGRCGRQGCAQCIHGHDYTPENTYIDGRGNRGCKECRKAAWQRHERRKRESTIGNELTKLHLAPTIFF
ncbi:MAG: HNH endonuclease [Hymenobacter sp.]|nr:MAG: HNH endonuclease [Hymenobacter sp.]